MNLQKLKTVHDTAPAEATATAEAFLAWGHSLSDFAADQPSDSRISRLQILTAAELSAFAGFAGRRARIEAGTTSENEDVRTLALTARDLLQSDVKQLDLNLPDRATLIEAFVATGLFSADDKTALYELATEWVSPFEDAGLGKVRLGYVQRMMEGL